MHEERRRMLSKLHVRRQLAVHDGPMVRLGQERDDGAVVIAVSRLGYLQRVNDKGQLMERRAV